MPDSDYLQRMTYYQGEFLDAQDFTLEQTYFQNQFSTLFLYYFSFGIAGAEQKQEPKKVTARIRTPKVVAMEEDSQQAVSFLLTLVSSGDEPASQDANYISVGKGLAIDNLSRQIVLLSGGVVDKTYFAGIKADTAYLTIAYAEQAGTANAKAIVQVPVFKVVAAKSDVPTGGSAFYLGTVTLNAGNIVGIQIEEGMRQYSRPYTGSQLNPSTASLTTAPKDDRDSFVHGLEERLSRLEGKVAAFLGASGKSAESVKNKPADGAGGSLPAISTGKTEVGNE